jgi:acetyl esterase/lipase
MPGPDPFHLDLRLHRRLPRGGPSTIRRVKLLRLATRVLPSGRPRPDVVAIGEHVSVRLFRPASNTTGGGLVWIHGGGMVIGVAKQDDALCRRIADELGATVASVEYRLAPEHPFPAPLDDCYAALQWLSLQPGIERVGVGGASAGGGLAAGVALAARDRGAIDLACQLLVYPMIDDRSGDGSGADESSFRLWNGASNRFGWAAYLGGATEISSYAAPTRASDLSGLPPTWIGVGTNDLFHDEDVSYAERLRAAGVPTQLEVVPGAYHGFDAVERRAAVSKTFIGSAVAFLGDHLRSAD